MKKALVFEPQYTDRRIDVSDVPASNPFSWFFPCKSIGPQYHHQLHDLRFLRAVGFHRCVHKSHSKNLSQFRFSCKPSRVHQTANLDCHVSECFLKHWTPSSLDCICIRSNLCSKHYVLLILLVTMCSWFHYDSYSGAVQTNCWSLFLCCTEQWRLWPSLSIWELAPPPIRQIVDISDYSQLNIISQYFFDYVCMWFKTVFFFHFVKCFI